MRRTAIIILAHLLMLFFLHTKSPTLSTKPAPAVRVETIQLIAKKPSHVEPMKKSSPPEKRDRPKPKSTSKPKESKRSVASHQKRRSMQQAIEKSLAALDTKPLSSSLPKEKSRLKLRCETLQNGSYEDELIAVIQASLELPKAGEVRLELTIDRWGSLIAKRIITAAPENREYLERSLAGLQLPPFGSYFEKEKSHCFPITLKAL